MKPFQRDLTGGLVFLLLGAPKGKPRDVLPKFFLGPPRGGDPPGSSLPLEPGDALLGPRCHPPWKGLGVSNRGGPPPRRYTRCLNPTRWYTEKENEPPKFPVGGVTL